MSIQQQLIQDASTICQSLTGPEKNSFQGRWVCISTHDWMSFIKKKIRNEAITSTNSLRLEFLDFIIENINRNNYGAGCHYELYEERRQEELRVFLSVLSRTEEESCYFKEKAEYSDDSNLYTMLCEQCGCEDSAFASAKSLQMEGVELCASCLDSRYC